MVKNDFESTQSIENTIQGISDFEKATLKLIIQEVE